MTVTSVHKDPKAMTLTISAEFDAPISRVWEMWEDPRQLERWWGPPTYPATFVDHDLSPDGSMSYFMSGPEDDQPHGWWRVIKVDAPNGLEFESGFADEASKPDPKMPTMIVRVTISEQTSGTTRMEVMTTFQSIQAMEQILEMGMEEGMVGALSQIDGLL
jgi:uncharacterized protein YndB with AHSA1/START domain